MATIFNPATSQLTWKGFADGARIAQPGAATISNPENKYKAYAAKAIGEMAYGGFNHFMNNMAEKREALEERDREYNRSENAFQNQDTAFPASMFVNPDTNNTSNTTNENKIVLPAGDKSHLQNKINNSSNEIVTPIKEEKFFIEDMDSYFDNVYTIDGIRYKDGKPIGY